MFPGTDERSAARGKTGNQREPVNQASISHETAIRRSAAGARSCAAPILGTTKFLSKTDLERVGNEAMRRSTASGDAFWKDRARRRALSRLRLPPARRCGTRKQSLRLLRSP